MCVFKYSCWFTLKWHVDFCSFISSLQSLVSAKQVSVSYGIRGGESVVYAISIFRFKVHTSAMISKELTLVEENNVENHSFVGERWE